jgi:hypothetical protein
MKKKPDKIKKMCWEFFHCLPEVHKACLISEIQDGKCWSVNIACCQINKDTPRPLSVKAMMCKTCEYYKEYHTHA